MLSFNSLVSPRGRRSFILLACGLLVGACSRASVGKTGPFEVQQSESDWRRRLSPEQFAVLRRRRTEQPGSSPLDKEFRPGTYHCAGCNRPLFASTAKFTSGTGWPSFSAALPASVLIRAENTLFGVQSEVVCSRCGGHLGHVFDDGPAPTGKRFCMNGSALVFYPS